MSQGVRRALGDSGRLWRIEGEADKPLAQQGDDCELWNLGPLVRWSGGANAGAALWENRAGVSPMSKGDEQALWAQLGDYCELWN